MEQDFSKIQPIRFYPLTSDNKFVKEKYYEKLHTQGSNSYTIATNTVLLPFTYNIPTQYTKITSLKLHCLDGSADFDIKGKLLEATDLKLISFINKTNNIVHRVIYTAANGFTGVTPANLINEGLKYLILVVTNEISGASASYRSDIIRIIPATSVNNSLIPALILPPVT